MPSFTVSPAEWVIAHAYLDNAADGIKLPYSVCYDPEGNEIIRERFKDSPKAYKTNHSFIKVNGCIYALSQGKESDAVIADGSISKVKYAQAEDGRLMIIKIDSSSTILANEGAISRDVDMSPGAIKRDDSDKNYIVLRYLGQNLIRYMKKNAGTITDAERLKLAISLTHQLFCLHTGRLAETKTPYAHRDLKRDNVTVDEAGSMHIIDYGLSGKQPQKPDIPSTGARTYLAYKAKGKVITKAWYDIVGLKRILFLPRQFYGSKGFVEECNSPEDQNLLPPSLLKRLGLFRYISTEATEGQFPDYDNELMDLVSICALLIKAALQLTPSDDNILNDEALRNCIVGLYFANKISLIDDVLGCPQKKKLVAALFEQNAMDNYDGCLLDQALMTKISLCPDLVRTEAILALESHKIVYDLKTVINSKPICQALVALARAGLFDCMGTLLATRSLPLAIAVKLLTDNNLESCLSKLFTNTSQLGLAIEKIDNDDNRAVLLKFIESDDLSIDELILICQDKRIAKAIMCYDAKYKHNQANYKANIKNIITHRECALAVNNAESLPFAHNYISYLADSVEKSRAFNILHDLGVNEKKNLDCIIYDKSTTELIIKLSEVGFGSLISDMLSDAGLGLNRWELSQLFKMDCASQLTIDMLSNEKIRGDLFDVSYHQESVKALINIIEAKLHSDDTLSLLKDNLCLAALINQLSQSALSCYMKQILQHPQNAWRISHLIKEKPTDEQLSLVMDNCALIYTYSIIDMDVLIAYTTCEELSLLSDSLSINEQQARAISTLTHHRCINKENTQKVLADRGFCDALLKATERCQVEAIIKASRWACDSSVIDKLSNPEHASLAKMIASTASKANGLKLINYYHNILDFQIEAEIYQAEGNNESHIAAVDLVTTLKTTFDATFTSKQSAGTLEVFKKNSAAAIRDGAKHLDAHSTLKRMLDTALTILLSLVVFYPLTYFYQKKHNIKATFFTTKCDSTAADALNTLNDLVSDSLVS